MQTGGLFFVGPGFQYSSRSYELNSVWIVLLRFSQIGKERLHLHSDDFCQCTFNSRDLERRAATAPTKDVETPMRIAADEKLSPESSNRYLILARFMRSKFSTGKAIFCPPEKLQNESCESIGTCPNRWQLGNSMSQVAAIVIIFGRRQFLHIPVYFC